MTYVCLRNCYVGERLWKQGKTYELPDAMEKNEKNFQLLGEVPGPEKVSEPIPNAPQAVSSPVKPDTIPDGQYWCPKCSTLHRETSKIGKKHNK